VSFERRLSEEAFAAKPILMASLHMSRNVSMRGSIETGGVNVCLTAFLAITII
jgi:hypothetical protein